MSSIFDVEKHEFSETDELIVMIKYYLDSHIDELAKIHPELVGLNVLSKNIHINQLDAKFLYFCVNHQNELEVCLSSSYMCEYNMPRNDGLYWENLTTMVTVKHPKISVKYNSLVLPVSSQTPYFDEIRYAHCITIDDVRDFYNKSI